MQNDTAYSDPELTQRDLTDNGHSKADFHKNLMMYIGIGIGVGIVACVVIAIVLLRYSRRRVRGRSWSRTSVRNLIVRGFSTVSQRGVVDSSAEFEMVNSQTHSSSSYDNTDTKHILSNNHNEVPKKPERRRTRTSSSNVKYENVTLDPKTGFVVRKSVGMQSDIPVPYIDTAGGKPPAQDGDDEDDDVFE